MVLVCPVIWQDHRMKRSCDFIGRSPSREVTILHRIGVHSYSGSGVIIILVCHVSSEDHMIKKLFDFIGGSKFLE